MEYFAPGKMAEVQTLWSKICSVFAWKEPFINTNIVRRLLSEQSEQCVFKGRTSLSKGFHIIDRFSEDIDITFSEHIGESRRKKLKNVVLKGSSEELENSKWGRTRISDKERIWCDGSTQP